MIEYPKKILLPMLPGELGADLLVVGSGGPRRGRRAVAATTRRAAIGRAADAIVRTAPCPVLVVRGDGAVAKELPDTEQEDR